jgi:hypothetical protein
MDSFNATNYLNNYSDLSSAFENDLESAIRHYILNGYSEGRTDLDINNNMKIEFSSLDYLSVNDYSMKKINQDLKIINPISKSINLEKQNKFNSNLIEAWKDHNYLNNTNELFAIERQF